MFIEIKKTWIYFKSEASVPSAMLIITIKSLIQSN